MNFYLSGSWSRREELQGYSAQLEQLGHHNVSSWLEPSEFDEKDHALSLPEMRFLAAQNLEDIRGADIFLVFTEPVGSLNTRGGRHVEWGFFMGHSLSVDPMPQFAVIGEVENMFYATHQMLQFKDFADFMEKAT